MPFLFSDRADAGRWLALRLGHLAGRRQLLVLGLPCGGIPVAAEVARALDAPLDVLVVQRLPAPGQPDLALGAVAHGDVEVRDARLITRLGLDADTVATLAERERRELRRRERAYRGDRPYPDLADFVVLLVDDGVATGATMLAAVGAVQAHHPAELVVAAPVMAREAYEALAATGVPCITLSSPEPFGSVGSWYQDFRPTTEAEVEALLARFRVTPPAPLLTSPRG